MEKQKKNSKKNLIVVVFSPQGSGLNYEVTGTMDLPPQSTYRVKTLVFPYHQQNNLHKLCWYLDRGENTENTLKEPLCSWD